MGPTVLPFPLPTLRQRKHGGIRDSPEWSKLLSVIKIVRRAAARPEPSAAWVIDALILSTLIFVFPQAAFSQETLCPETISVKQTIEKVPQGWTAGQAEDGSTLAGITFFSGPPEERASLVYDKWTKRNGLAYGVWHFQPDPAHRIWVSCRYSGTRVVLAKPLPADTTECTVTYDQNVQVAGEPRIRKISCHQ
jgi:hypothetical protein